MMPQDIVVRQNYIYIRRIGLQGRSSKSSSDCNKRVKLLGEKIIVLQTSAGGKPVVGLGRSFPYKTSKLMLFQ